MWFIPSILIVRECKSYTNTRPLIKCVPHYKKFVHTLLLDYRGCDTLMQKIQNWQDSFIPLISHSETELSINHHRETSVWIPKYPTIGIPEHHLCQSRDSWTLLSGQGCSWRNPTARCQPICEGRQSPWMRCCCRATTLVASTWSSWEQ